MHSTLLDTLVAHYCHLVMNFDKRSISMGTPYGVGY